MPIDVMETTEKRQKTVRYPLSKPTAAFPRIRGRGAQGGAHFMFKLRHCLQQALPFRLQRGQTFFPLRGDLIIFPGRTAAAYVQNPLNTAYPEVIYRTGDIGKYNGRGELVFVSRKDFQIKHMGHRIELGEVEVNVAMLPGVRMAGCIYDSEKKKIVLWYDGDPDEKELTGELKTRLPRYMLPNRIYKVDKLPFTANGKIDRVALRKMYEKG